MKTKKYGIFNIKYRTRPTYYVFYLVFYAFLVQVFIFLMLFTMTVSRIFTPQVNTAEECCYPSLLSPCSVRCPLWIKHCF